MTQAFSGQMDGTSGTGMGLKPPKPGSFGIWGPPTTKVEATSLNQEPAKCAIPFALWRAMAFKKQRMDAVSRAACVEISRRRARRLAHAFKSETS